jgi:hypothetical protein
VNVNLTDRRPREPRLGVDIGRVIIAGHGTGDTSFFDGDDAALLATPEMPGSFDEIAGLVPLFGGMVWLVSKCGPRVQSRTLRWLNAHDFWGRTGVAADATRFCLRRPDKRGICQDLALTHYVDDRPDVHTAIGDVVEYRYLFGPQHVPPPAGTIHVLTWAAAGQSIRLALTGGTR